MKKLNKLFLILAFFFLHIPRSNVAYSSEIQKPKKIFESSSTLEKEVESLVLPKDFSNEDSSIANAIDLLKLDPQFLLDGVSYYRSDIIRDFLNVAFSDTQWYQYIGREDFFFRQMLLSFSRKLLGDAEHSDTLSGKISWISSYVDLPKGLPKNGVINKWSDEITIGIDWPEYQIGLSSGPIKDGRYREFYEVARREITNNIPELHAATSREVRLLETPLDAYQNKIGKIRIIPVSLTGEGYFFKTPLNKSNSQSHVGISDLEKNLWGAVPFTPYSRAQVDGYLLPNEGNKLGMAFCKINVSIGELLIKALIKECLFRAVGLPGSSSLSSGVSSNWNLSFEGDYNPALRVVPDYNIFNVDKKDGYSPFPSGLVNQMHVPTKYSEYDRLLIALLYCDAIKSGMNKSEVIDILLKNEKCFKVDHKG